MGKCLKVRKGDGIRIGDDVLVEINQGSPNLFIQCPAGMRIELVKREERFERPARRNHNIMPPAAMVLVAALLLGGCSDPAARTLSEKRDAVYRSTASRTLTSSGSLSFYPDDAVGSGLRDREQWRMIESTPWPTSVDPRDRESVEIPQLPAGRVEGVSSCDCEPSI